MATPTSLPSNIRPPLTLVTLSDQRGIIAIVTGFSIGLQLLSTGVRVYAKQYAGVLRGDDIAFYLAVIFGIAQSGVALYLVKLGWGRLVDLLDEQDLKTLRKVC
jgi:hypothetical protein